MKHSFFNILKKEKKIPAFKLILLYTEKTLITIIK